MRSIAIVGAGPAGLVAAKHLIHHNSRTVFNVTVFDKQSHVGGMWALEEGGGGGKCSPEMRVNLSRFTVAFDDLDWADVDVEKSPRKDARQPSTADEETQFRARARKTPMFPKAWQVGRYLQAYAAKFVPGESLRLGCTVTSASLEELDGRKVWKVRWTKAVDESLRSSTFLEGIFDYVIVASGFFSEPAPPNFDTRGATGARLHHLPNMVHSSEFRNLESLLSGDDAAKANLVVVGGSMSGAEAAATAAYQISNAKYSPEPSRRLQGCKVYHVFHRQFYPIPRFIAGTTKHMVDQDVQSAPDIVPVDLGLFKYGDDRTPKAVRGRVPPWKARETHDFLTSVVSGATQQNQSKHHENTLSTRHQPDLPPFIAVSDDYAEYVRSGDIIPVRGTVASVTVKEEPASGDLATRVELRLRRDWAVDASKEDSYSSGTDVSVVEETAQEDGKETIISEIAALVYATGFEPHKSLDWLPGELLDSMGYDRHARRMPLLLQHHCTGHDRFPGLAFVGFYEGPYWGVMEMQAEHIAAKWVKENESRSSEEPRTSEESLAELQELASIRDAQKTHDKSVPQFWMGDHIGVRREIATKLAIRGRHLGEATGDAGFSLRYQHRPGLQSTLENHLRMETRVRNFVRDEVGDQYVPAAVFRSLQGRWQLHRKLSSKLPGFPSGDFDGTASFHPRKPTDRSFDGEHLYAESGTLKTEHGVEMQASRHYAYRYESARPSLSAWFVKSDDLTVDYLFHTLERWNRHSEDAAVPGGWKAGGEHLCVRDMYNAEYTFHFRGSSVDRFAVKYNVKGPESDSWVGGTQNEGISCCSGIPESPFVER